MARSSKKAKDAGFETSSAGQAKEPSDAGSVGGDGASRVQGDRDDSAKMARRRKGHVTWWCQRQLHDTCAHNHKSHGGICECDCHTPSQSGIRLAGTA